jgi:hypothetical protein
MIFCVKLQYENMPHPRWKLFPETSTDFSLKSMNFFFKVISDLNLDPFEYFVLRVFEEKSATFLSSLLWYF